MKVLKKYITIFKSEKIMEIKICGPGCAKCDEAYNNALSAVKRLGQDVSVNKITDF